MGWLGPLTNHRGVLVGSSGRGWGWGSVAVLGVEGQAARHTLQCDLVSSLRQVLPSRAAAPREALICARVSEALANTWSSELTSRRTVGQCPSAVPS